MSYTKEEVIPLVGGRRVIADSPSNRVGTRRRVGPQHVPTFEQSMYSVDASEKIDRRSCCNRFCSNIGNACCSGPQTNYNFEYYEDSFNDEPWRCSCGTGENDGIWTNQGDKVGTVMSSMVWVLFLYAIITISFLAQNNGIRPHVAMTFTTICTLALACHAKTMLTDPGSIPQEAVPLAILFKQGVTTHAMCSHCQTYKPPNSHHCRICNRCISHMDRTYMLLQYCLLVIALREGMDLYLPWFFLCRRPLSMDEQLRRCQQF
eukprot:scaffold3840_cov129-Cylindrotheca_fusiformis.AAC.12